MKRRLTLLLLLALILAAAVSLRVHPESAAITAEHFEPLEDVSVMIATDLHYLAPELTDHGAYFQKVTQNADGKMTEYAEELLEALIRQAVREAPDALILSGDLTFNGEAVSHQMLAEKLQTIEDAGISVLLLPGNHDLNDPMAAQFEGDGFRRVESVTAEGFAEIYSAFIDRKALGRDTDSLSYVAELAPGLRALLVDVNTAEAPGAISKATLAWVEAQLQDAADAGAWVLAVSHQNVLAHNSLFTDGYVLDGAQQLLALYEQYPVICNLSGHIHLQHIAESGTGFREIATSSLAVYPNQYGLLRLHDYTAHYQTAPLELTLRETPDHGGELSPIDFSSSSRQFFWDNGYRQALAALGGTDSAQDLAAFFADVNTAYFAGRMDALVWDAKRFDVWQETNSFFSYYLKSIAGDGFRDHTTASFVFGGMTP